MVFSLSREGFNAYIKQQRDLYALSVVYHIYCTVVAFEVYGLNARDSARSSNERMKLKSHLLHVEEV